MDEIVEEYLSNKTNAKRFDSCLMARKMPEDKSPKRNQGNLKKTKKVIEEPCANSKNRKIDVKTIIAMRKSGATFVDIAKKFGVNESSVRRAIKKASM